MLKIKVIEQCPHTVTGQGVLHLTHDVIATLAGAVYERNEWIALLLGTRSDNGLDIHVTGLRVPKQTRDYASCELANPEPLTDDVVGVIHSHHSMGAFFSQTDRNTLNPRFPLSLVVAHPKHGSSDLEKLLGFSYLAEGCVPLPCGTPGIVNFKVIPSPTIPEWPVLTPAFTEANENITLFYCPHVVVTEGQTIQRQETKCGVVVTEPKRAAFGKDGAQFLTEVKDKTIVSKYQNNWVPGQHKHHGQPHYPGMPVIDNRRYWSNGVEHGGPFVEGEEYDERWLRHWGV